MEIADYLRIARRRLGVLILVPLLAAGAAVASVLLAPPEYSSSATLSTNAFVGCPSCQFTGTQAAAQFAAAFSAKATGDRVLSTASEETQIAESELRDGLAITQEGASSDMTLAFTSQQRLKVEPALRAINSATLSSMFNPQVELAKSKLADARDAFAAADQKVIEYTEKYGAAAPETQLEAQTRRLAIRTLASAQTAYDTALRQLEAAQASDNLFVNPVNTVSQTQSLVRTVIPVVGAAIFLAIILVMILELLANARRRSRESDSDDRVLSEVDSQDGRRRLGPDRFQQPGPVTD